MSKAKGLKVVHEEKLVDVSDAQGCIGAYLNKRSGICRLDARIPKLRATSEVSALLDRLGELLVAEFPSSLKAATIDNENALVAWVLVTQSSSRGNPHKEIARLKDVLADAGVKGVLIGSVIVDRKKPRRKKIH